MLVILDDQLEIPDKDTSFQGLLAMTFRKVQIWYLDIKTLIHSESFRPCIYDRVLLLLFFVGYKWIGENYFGTRKGSVLSIQPFGAQRHTPKFRMFIQTAILKQLCSKTVHGMRENVAISRFWRSHSSLFLSLDLKEIITQQTSRRHDLLSPRGLWKCGFSSSFVCLTFLEQSPLCYELNSPENTLCIPQQGEMPFWNAVYFLKLT